MMQLSRIFGGDGSRQAKQRVVDDPNLEGPDYDYATRDVIGNDDRFQVTDAKEPPFRQIGLLYGYVDNDSRKAKVSGTGWLIGRDKFVTAGHNLFNKRYGRKNNHLPACVKIWLGQNGESASGFGVRRAEHFIVHSEYLRNRRNDEFDIAVIKLDRPVDEKHGFLHAIEAPHAGEMPIGVVGYPYKKNQYDPPTRMFYSYGEIALWRKPVLFHTADTGEGQSGAPILIEQNNGVRVIGVHTRGDNAGRRHGVHANMGILLTRELLQWIRAQN